MPVPRRTRIVSAVITILLILFALFAILGANSLSWPFVAQFLNRNNNQNPPHPPPTGELVVRALLTYSTFQGTTYSGPTSTTYSRITSSNYSGTALSIFVSPAVSIGPIQVNVTVMALRPERVLISNETDSNGLLVANLTQGSYDLVITSPYTNFTTRISMVSSEITNFTLNVTATDRAAVFYDLVDPNSIGQVLPSQNIYLEVNGTLPPLNSNQTFNLQTFQIQTCAPFVCMLGGNFPQTVSATVLSTSQSLGNNTTWLVLTPQAPVNTFGVSQLFLTSYSPHYTISITNSTGTGLQCLMPC